MEQIRISDHFTMERLLRFVLPSIAMMIFISIYGVVDGFFVSNFVGKTPFASLNLVMPFLLILGAVGFVFGTGGSALVAKTLGENKRALANRYFTMILIVAVIVGLALSLFGVIFMEPIVYRLGASEAMAPYCVVYGRISTIFMTAFILQNVFQSFLIAAEKPHIGLYATVAAGMTNMILDALFIIVFKWGLAGAALATGLGELVGVIVPLAYFIWDKNSLITFVKTKIEWRAIGKAAVNGLSEFVNNIAMAVVGVLYNLQLMRFAGENGVAAYGVLMYVQLIFAGAFIGFSIGAAPIVSFHFGAENHSELKNILKKSTLFMVVTGIAMTLLAMSFAGPIADIFVGYDDELRQMTMHAFRLFSFAFLFMGFGIYGSSFFTALNNGVVSAIISFMRTMIFEVGCVLLLPMIFALDGIWLSGVFAEALAVLVAVIFIFAYRKKYHYM